jgi:hypothetical protein
MENMTANERAVLAEKMWDAFRSLNMYQGEECRKTYGQLSVPHQNLWLALASAASREISMMDKRRARKKSEPARRRQ